jgi:hypothetical protein
MSQCPQYSLIIELQTLLHIYYELYPDESYIIMDNHTAQWVITEGSSRLQIILDDLGKYY